MGDQGKERPIVEFRHITKQFSGVKVLEDVSFFINRGEVHCILGENGAGKSTLMKILTGVYHAEEGEILINGERVNVCDIREARKLNIGTVFQENSLVPHMTVAENIFLTREIKNRSGLVDWKKMRSETIRWGQELGVELDPDIRVKKLTVAGQQLVEIVKVFSQNPQIVILDEPTSSLSDKEIDNLFSIIRRMQKKGVTFIYISHRMEEIKQIGNSGTVLRDGKFVVRIEDVCAMEIENIISYIVGRPLDEQFPKRKAVIGDVLLEAKNITVPGLVQDVSFQVKRGEVLGFSGLVGAGRSETAKAVFGSLRRTGGQILIDGRQVNIRSPHEAIKAGIGLLPENRKEEGLVLNKSIAWNIVFSSLGSMKGKFLLSGKREGEAVDHYTDQLHIKTTSSDKQVKFLSGGNQQKVVFAKWLCAKSSIYIFDEPTRGIDVGAKSEIYGIINDLVSGGNAVIVISSELPEILGICDRIAVFHEGSIKKIIDRKEATQENIMYYALGGRDE